MDDMGTPMPFANFGKAYEKELQKFAETIEGNIQLPDESKFHTSVTSYPIFSGMYSGKKIQISVNVEVGVPFLEIDLVSQFDFQVLLVKETLASKIGKGLGIEHEITLEGRAKLMEFNRKFLIKGMPKDKIRSFLAREGVAETAESLGNFEKLSTKENHISVWYLVNSENDLKADTFLERVKLLHQLAGYVE